MKKSVNSKILRSLRPLRMTWGKGVNVFPLSKGEGQNEGFITNLRKELINLSTYPLINFQKAFTLAEILITLGIIGIVAAITIPNLIQNNFEKKTISQLRETQSILIQAIRMAEEEYGDVEGWVYMDIASSSQERYDEWSKLTLKITENLRPFMKFALDCGTLDEEYKCIGKSYKHLNLNPMTDFNKSLYKYKVMLLNGSTVIWQPTTGTSTNPDTLIQFNIDTNGPSKPNIYGKDTFLFEYTKRGLVPMGAPGTLYEYDKTCKLDQTGSGCAYYVLNFGNMNYLHKNK